MVEDVRARLLELDKKIHEKVFGAALISVAEMKAAGEKLMARRPEGSYWFPADNNAGFYANKSETGHVTYKQSIACYSTHMTDAFLVVTYMRRNGYAFRLQQMHSEPGFKKSDLAVVSFVCSKGPCPDHGFKAENHHGAYDVEADTVEQAICLAAIKAKLCILSAPISKRKGAGVIMCNQPRPCKYHEVRA